jgi:hypothetical protein
MLRFGSAPARGELGKFLRAARDFRVPPSG